MFDPVGVSDLQASLDKVKLSQKHLLPDEPPSRSIRPFGLDARKRAAAAGMKWHYEFIYTIASDYSHANARAISEYMKPQETGGIPSASLLAIEFVLRSMFFADGALNQFYTHVLDDYAARYARLALPRSEVDTVVASLQPPPRP